MLLFVSEFHKRMFRHVMFNLSYEIGDSVKYGLEMRRATNTPETKPEAAQGRRLVCEVL